MTRGALMLWVVLVVSPGACAAAAYPGGPVTVVVPYPVSGPTDIRGTSRLTKTYKLVAQHAPPAISDTLARIAADAIRAGSVVEVRLERQPGGSTTRGAASVARARPDGLTLLLGSNSALLVAPRYYRNAGYQGLADFVLARPLATMAYVLMSHVALPADDARGLINWLRVRPGEINYGSSGDGSTGHLAGELFRRMTGVAPVHVGYNGGLAALNAVATHHVTYLFAAMPLALPFAGNQYVKPLAVTTLQRSALLPEVPTLAESGLAGYHVEGWFGIFAPARTPGRAVAWLDERIGAQVRDAAIQSELRAHGLEPAGGSREQFATRIHTENHQMAAFVLWLQAQRAAEDR